MSLEHLDVLIVGAGLSGIGAAYHLQDDCPGKTYAILEARERHRRHLGPVPLPGHPLRLRHVHARLLVPAVDGGEGDRRRPVDPRVHPRHRARVRHRRADPLPPPGRARRLVDATTRAGPSRPSAPTRRRRCALTCGFLFMCSGYYRYDEGYTPEFPGMRALRRPDRAPAALARGPRLRRQARRRDRQRRDGGDARPRDGRDGRARHDAAALADLHRLAAGARTRSPTCLRRVLPAKLGLRRSCAGRTCCCTHGYLPAQPAPPDAREAASCARASSGSCPPATTSTRTSRRRYNPWDQRLCLVPDGDLFEAISDGRRVGRHRPHRDVHRDRHPARSRAPSSRPTSIVTATGLDLLVARRHRSSPSTARRSTCRDAWPTRA